MKKKIALVMAVVLLMVATVGGTLAWLTAKSDTVTNTFTTSDISVTLTETKGTTTTSGSREFQMIPGYTIEKDPKATVVSGSEKCWLFVKVEMTNNTYTSGETTINYLSYEIADGWTAGQGTGEGKDGIPTNVYYRKVDGTTNQIGTDYPVFKDNKVTVSGNVDKAAMTAAKTTQPTITLTAYASQLYKNNNATDNEFTAAEAWDNITTK